MKCVKNQEIELLRSNAGIYLGTTTEYGEPNCRCSLYLDPTLVGGNLTDEEVSEIYTYNYRDCIECNSCSGRIGGCLK